MMYRQPLDNARYPSIADFLDAVNAPATHADNECHRKQHAEGYSDGGDTWYGAGCKTGSDVARMVSDGWPRGRDRMQKLQESITGIKLTPRDRRRKIVRRDAGDALDIHRVYSGRLDIAWSRPERQATLGPQRIDLCANMLCSGYEHSDVLFYRGAAAAVLTGMLQAAGYMVRLTVIFGGTNAAGEKVSCRITVKNHGMPLDITSTSATILPGFFRALGHAWISGHSLKKIYGPGISVGQGVVDKNEILLSHNVRDHGTAIAFINETLTKINQGKAA